MKKKPIDRLAYSIETSGPTSEFTVAAAAFLKAAGGKATRAEALHAMAAARPELFLLDLMWREALQTRSLGCLPLWLHTRALEAFAELDAPGAAFDAFAGYEFDETLERYREKVVADFGYSPTVAVR